MSDSVTPPVFVRSVLPPALPVVPAPLVDRLLAPFRRFARTTAAIVDDIGAVLVIAVSYSSGIAWGALGATAAVLLLAASANFAGVRHPWAYGILGLVLWIAVLTSGIHATVAGVLLAMTIPVRTRLNEAAFLASARQALDDFDAAAVVTATDPNTTVLSNVGHHTALRELEALSDQTQPPLIRFEHTLHGVVAFGIMPLFALANAGVSFDAPSVRAAVANPVTLGVALGLLVGKVVGITAFSWLAVRSRIATLPAGVTWQMVASTGVLGGIGFTMAIFIGGLAFPEGVLRDAAKIGVLVASTCAGIGGWVLVRGSTSRMPA